MSLAFPPEFPFHRPADDRSASSPAPAVPVTPAVRSPLPTVPQLVAATSGATPAVERRRSPRQTLVAKASIRPDTSVQMASLMTAGFVSNISMNGVGFHTRKPLEVGGKYRIMLEVGPMKWSSRLRIVTCRHHPESETFDCGAEFIGNELNRLPLSAAA